MKVASQAWDTLSVTFAVGSATAGLGQGPCAPSPSSKIEPCWSAAGAAVGTSAAAGAAVGASAAAGAAVGAAAAAGAAVGASAGAPAGAGVGAAAGCAEPPQAASSALKLV